MFGLLKKTPNMNCSYLSQSKQLEGEEVDGNSLVELDMDLLKVKKESSFLLTAVGVHVRV